MGLRMSFTLRGIESPDDEFESITPQVMIWFPCASNKHPADLYKANGFSQCSLRDDD
jgi:hypothetical protein